MLYYAYNVKLLTSLHHLSSIQPCLTAYMQCVSMHVFPMPTVITYLLSC